MVAVVVGTSGGHPGDSGGGVSVCGGGGCGGGGCGGGGGGVGGISPLTSNKSAGKK